MSLHIELRVAGKLSYFVPRSSTIVALSNNLCLLIANDIAFAVVGVSAEAVNEAINGNLAVIDVLYLSWCEVSTVVKKEVRASLIREADSRVARKNLDPKQAALMNVLDAILSR